MRNVQDMQDMQSTVQGMQSVHRFLRAEHVGKMLGIDRSTVYRMAENGRLPALKIGRQWRFPAEQIERLLEAHPGDLATQATQAEPGRRALLSSVRDALPLIELSAEILGVMVVVTDMDGEPVTDVVNPCPWFSEQSGDPELLARCLSDWKQLADDPDFDMRFRTGPLNFDCARAFIRLGPQLIGMLLVGGIAATDDDPRALYRLSAESRARVLASLPLIAARVSRLIASLPSDVSTFSSKSNQE